MKCDELKDYDYDPDFPFQSRGIFYIADEVEAAIDELKQKLHDAEMAKDDAEAANTEYREDIRKLKAENERLKDENARLKNCNVVHIEDFINQSFELRYTKRALWMARAKRAQERKANNTLFKSYIKSHKSSWFIDGNELELAWDLWEEAFDRVEKICLKKAEEYK